VPFFSKRLVRAGALVVLTAGMAACGGSVGEDDGDDGGSAQSPDANEPLSIVAATTNMADPTFITVQCGAESQAADLNVDFEWRGVNTFEPQPLVDLVNQVGQQDPDGLILIPPAAPPFKAPVRTLMSNGVPVVSVGGPLDVEYKNFNSSNQEGGEALADLVGKENPGPGSVAVIGLAPGTNPESPRDTAFIAWIKEHYPDLEVLPEQYVLANSAKAAQVTTSLIQSNSDLKAIFGTDGPTVLGILSGVKAAKSDVKVYGYDAQPAQVKALKAGEIEALVAPPYYKMGQEAIAAAAEAARASGGEAVTPASPLTETLPVMLLTQDNIDTPEGEEHQFRSSC